MIQNRFKFPRNSSFLPKETALKSYLRKQLRNQSIFMQLILNKSYFPKNPNIPFLPLETPQKFQLYLINIDVFKISKLFS